MHRIFSGKLIIYCVLLFFLDASLMPIFREWGFFPVLLYLMVPYAAFVWHWERTMGVALWVGFLRDISGGHILGIEMLSLVVSAYLLDLFVQKIEREILMMRLVANFLFLFIHSVFILAILTLLGGPVGISWNSLLLAFGLALSTTAVLPIFFLITSTFFQDQPLLKQLELF